MIVDHAELMRNIPVCGGLTSETIKFVLRHSHVRNVAAGDFFFREGDVGDCLYVIRSGTAVVERTWNDEPIVIARVGAGDCFGEMSLIDLQRRFASVRGESDCTAIEVPYNALCKLCREDVEQYAMVMMNLGREVSRRLRIAGERLFQYQQELGQQWFDEQVSLH